MSKEKPKRERKRLEIKGKHLIAGFLVLLLIVGITAWWNLSHSERGADGYSLTIARDGAVLKTFSIKEIKKLPEENVYAKLSSAQHDDAEGTFQGADLREVLNQTDPSLLEECGTFICTAGDGYSSALSAKELSKEKNVLVAYGKDKKIMEHFYEGGEGPMRLIIASDTYGNRSVKFLTKIECRK